MRGNGVCSVHEGKGDKKGSRGREGRGEREMRGAGGGIALMSIMILNYILLTL